ncbi:non-ribosomal peptide synthetase [Micromonospora sp. NPDC051543]|uniref:non-ribosomal peptide synthetase n=1 Tax=Micromonospora sp. NPDC051543 TaxID=3364287 RepID=UPI0037BD695A
MAYSCVQEAFAAAVERAPDAVAVSSGAGQLTYRDLDVRSSEVAERLRALGVGPETVVAVLMERSPELVVTLLGVLKAGGCYLPLPASYPRERMQAVIDRAGCGLLITDRPAHDDGLPAVPHVLRPGEGDPVGKAEPVHPVHPDQLAYLMFTSGSSGDPKGVAITHRGVLNMAADPVWAGGGHDVVLMVAPHAFGVTAYELWVPLLHGNRLVLAPLGDLDVHGLRALIERERVTGLHLTAGLFRVVAEEAATALAGVREVLTGGDVIAPTAVSRVLDACPETLVQAMYGQTEATAFVTRSPMAAPYQAGQTVPVGRPLAGVRLYVLDGRLEPVAPGVTGELYVAGPCLARGYHGRPDQTAVRFVADPFTGGGERMYRTGDLARLTSQGLVEFVGRASDQIKVRGYLVELREVEAVLGRGPGVAHVAVTAHEVEAGEKRVVAYVVPGPAGVDDAKLAAYARTLLPDYMLPDAVMTVPALPLTPNGKLDRRALPEPQFSRASDYRPPRGPRQERLCEIFAEVLGAPRVGADDDFFALGGHSLLAMRLVNRVRSALGVDIRIDMVFDAPTVAALDERLDVAQEPERRPR